MTYLLAYFIIALFLLTDWHLNQEGVFKSPRLATYFFGVIAGILATTVVLIEYL